MDHMQYGMQISDISETTYHSAATICARMIRERQNPIRHPGNNIDFMGYALERAIFESLTRKPKGAEIS